MAVAEKHIMGRLYLVAGLLLAFSVFMVSKLIDIQAIEGGHHKKLAMERTERVATIPPIRGNIFSDDGSLLAASVAKYTVHMDTATPKDGLWGEHINALCDSLGILFHRPASYYRKKLRKARANKNRHLLLAKNIDYPEFTRMRRFPLLKEHPYTGGFKHSYEVVREHPLGEMAWRSIGYERVDDQGHYTRVGIDGAFGKEFLRGVVGKRMEQKTGGDVWKPMTLNNIVEPQDGMDVVSTINTNIQDIAHNELLKQLRKYDADHGCVVVMDVKTGAVKAIANLGKNRNGEYVERRNYAVWETHEPGSTFKSMTLLAALEDGKVDTVDVFETHNGKWKVYGKEVKDSRKTGYGKISIAEAFAVSSNTVFAQLVHDNYMENPEQFVDRLRNFKLHEPLGIPIKGEGIPRIRYPGENGWSGLSLAWMSHGYEVALTPLQTLTFYNAIANGGKMVRPRFVKKVCLGTKVIEEFDADIMINSIASKANINKMQQLMRNVIEKDNGTGRKLFNKDFSMAGKTGTCWKNYWKNTKEGHDYISSFVGYFPAEEPEYSCIVVIHEPNQEVGIYGADVAGPVFKSMAQKIYLTSPLVDEVDAIMPKIQQLDKNYEAFYAKSQKKYTTMPNLEGMSGMDAIALLENLGLKVEVSGSGKVVKQSVPKGTKVGSVNKVILKLS